MKTLTLADITWTLEALPEGLPLKGNVLASGDDAEDTKAENWVRRQLREGNEWAWCCAHVVGDFNGLTADDYLGACSYKSREDFIAPGGYYDDMRGNVLAELQSKAEAIAENITEA